MKRRVIAAITAIVVLAAGVVGYDYWKKETGGTEGFVYAETYRNGILLVPTDIDATGISPNTTFRLSFEDSSDLDLTKLEGKIVFDPLVPFDLVEDNEGYLIKPKASLDMNQVYTIKVYETSWSFQTASAFGVIGSLPRHQSTGVPTNSGIEMYFNRPGAEVKDYFTIEPSVKGKFETYGSAVVFVPNKLEPMTVYTVTLKSGLGIKGSESLLEEDFVFSFETDYDESQPFEQPAGYFNYFKILNDRPSGEGISLPLQYGVNEPPADGLTVETKIYAYSDSPAMIEALSTYLDMPTWTNYGMMDKKDSAVKGLDKVMDFKQTIEDTNGYETTIDLPTQLPEGFYLVKSTWKDIQFQTFLQVTDLSTYWFADDVMDYYWMNDLKSSKPSVGAWRSDSSKDLSDDHGFLQVPKGNEEGYAINILTDGDKELVHYTYNGPVDRFGHYSSNSDDYWRYIQLDRALYKPEDTVKVFGFLQNRDQGTYPDEVTVAVAQQSWFYYDFWPGLSESLPLVQTKASLEKGFYEADLELPNLEQGGYQITVTAGDETLATEYFSVENYVKPDYKIDVSADKAAIFYDETVTFTVNTAFFEGTPVADLETYYDVYGISSSNGKGNTDLDGNYAITYTPGYRAGYQDQVQGGFYARAVMPESGELYGNASVRIFVNDIDVAILTKEEDGKGTIEVNVNTITLDRLNSDTAEDYNDYLDQPVEGKNLEGVVYRKEWVKREAGEYYDFINKVTRMRYRYDEVVTVFDRVTLVTDAQGKAKVDLDLPEEKNVHYTLELKTQDNQGHEMIYERWFTDNSRFYYPDDTSMRLELDKETYDLGEPIQATITKGGELVEAEQFLFVYGSRGLKGKAWSDEAVMAVDFQASFVPNVEVTGIVFDGRFYTRAYGQSARVNLEDKTIDLSIKADQESYKPGDEVTISIQALLGNGELVTDGVVNLAIVDEALLALRDMDVETLSELYGWVSSGVNGFQGTHDYERSDRVYGIGMASNVMLKGEESVQSADMAMEMTTMEAETSRDGGGVQVRSEFKDTALFTTVLLDEKGQGSLTFTLPDNVTSWRVTASAISESLEAGSETEALKVSLPFFINTTMNQTYLVGDEPYIGVSGYGAELTKDTTIKYTVICEAVDYSATATGKAFEKVALPLFELEEGRYEIQVFAEADNGLKDGYQEVVDVLRTYQQKRVTDLYEAEPGLTFETSEFGFTGLTFTDKGRGMLLPEIYRLAYGGGKRVDQTWLAGKSWQLLEEAFGIEGQEDVSIDGFISYDGGIALLPYGDTDPEVTAKLASLVDSQSSRERVKSYLYQKYYNGPLDQRSMMLYGLASMGEPVLLEINQWADIDNLSPEDRVWLAMAYASLGDTYMAKVIYDEHIKVDMEIRDTRARYIGVSGEDAQYRFTSILLPLLAEVETETGEKALDYLRSRRSEVYLANADIYGYLTRMLEKAPDQKPSLTYRYDGVTYKVDFDGWFGKSIKLPSLKMADFEVVEAGGSVLIVADYNAIGSLDQDVDQQVEVSRRYLDYETGEEKGNFSQGDIVKVVIDWKIDSDAIDHGYSVTDYAPSGLVPIKNTWQLGLRDGGGYWYRDIDGQKVTFGAYKNTKNYEPCVYYARVVSPGSFKADQVMIQGHQVLDSYNLSDNDIITIEPR